MVGDAALRDQVKQLRAENARLLRLLELTPQQARPPGPAQAGFFDTAPGAVDAGSAPAEKVAFFRALFAARTNVYAVRWETPDPGNQDGCQRCAAAGAKASRPPTGSICR
jgi:hypothetical protein